MSYVLTFCLYVLTLFNNNGGFMIQLQTMTKEEYEEVNMHFVVHDFADLCIAKGYDYMMSELAKVLDEKVDRLEPV